MKLGLIGLGKMGNYMTQRLLKDNHEVIVFDLSQDLVKELEAKGAQGSQSVEDLVAKLPERKVVWIMVPQGKPVDETIEKLTSGMKKGDIIIDGGNSNWRDTQARGEELKERGFYYIDCGTSGGIWGLERGYCLMYGGEKEPCDYAEPVFKSLAPKDGYLHCGGSGSGHFVKMVHNGIEYGMMQAYAEGFEIMEKSPFGLDLNAVSKVWQHSSVIQSWLLELTERALKEDPKLDKLEAFVQDSGEGRWTVQAAIDFDVPAPVITNSLFRRFASRDKDSYGLKLLAAMRNQFGGHAVKEK